jgi:hypothetical protein
MEAIIICTAVWNHRSHDEGGADGQRDEILRETGGQRTRGSREAMKHTSDRVENEYYQGLSRNVECHRVERVISRKKKSGENE